MMVQAGATGALPDRILPAGGVTLIVPVTADLLGLRIGAYLTAVIPSPMIEHGRYVNGLPANPLMPFGANNFGLKFEGARQPASAIWSGEATLVHRMPIGYSEFGLIGWSEAKPIIWEETPDAVIKPLIIGQRDAFGWQAQHRWMHEQWRARVAAIQIAVSEPKHLYDDVRTLHRPLPEPRFRAIWEAGWHETYWNEVFEADIALSGQVFSRFESRLAPRDQRLGDAYPIDLRFTGRIKQFNFYYAIHNIGAFPYHLVPYYRMMHREEYWGIEWTLFD
ncbi:MAG: hypothetical protein FJY67_08955 [Calditrichaeota bacterium]|nr:hypothetical protein [Calditrichota bacterium]